MENIIYELPEKGKPEGKRRMPLIPKRSQSRYAIFIAFAFVTLLLSLPLFTQTHIHVEVRQNQITDVWVETPQVSLISTIIPTSEGVGINTIVITIYPTGDFFKLNDVPSGEHIEVWVSDGTPKTGTYTIGVQLIQNNNTVDTFTLNVSF